MTHKSRFCYGYRSTREAHSGAVSGEVRVSYFDPVTGRPCKRKPEPRSKQLEAAAKPAPRRKRDGFRLEPRSRNFTACEVDGVEYESIAAAARATGISYATLQGARRDGRRAAAGHPVRFWKAAR